MMLPFDRPLDIPLDFSERFSVSGTTDYTELENKPKINGVELVGDKSAEDLGLSADFGLKVQNGALCAVFDEGGE